MPEYFWTGGSGGGGGGGAPTDASYVVGAAHGSLSAELVLGSGVNMSVADEASKPAASLAGRLVYVVSSGILYRDTGAAWVEVARSGENGTAGVDDPDTYAAVRGADEGYDAEFDGASLPAGWSTLNGGTSVVAVANGLASITTPQGTGLDARMVARTIPVETHWIAEAKLLTAGNGQSGLVLIDNAGQDILTMGWHHPANQLLSECRSYSGWVSGGPATWDYVSYGVHPTYWRMEFNAGAVLFSFSQDGWNWATPQGASTFDSTTHVVSPSHVGFFAAQGASGDTQVSCDWFRVRTP